jgi:hypothetical protein
MRLFDIARTVTTAEAAEWSYARQILLQGKRLRAADYEACRRALQQIGAQPIGRNGGRGRPMVWRMPDRPR